MVLYLAGGSAAVLAVGITAGYWGYPAILLFPGCILMAVRALDYPEFAALVAALDPWAFRRRVRVHIAARDLEVSLARCPDTVIAATMLAHSCDELGIDVSAERVGKAELATMPSPGSSSAVLVWPAPHGDSWLMKWKPNEMRSLSITQLLEVATYLHVSNTNDDPGGTAPNRAFKHPKPLRTHVLDAPQIS